MEKLEALIRALKEKGIIQDKDIEKHERRIEQEMQRSMNNPKLADMLTKSELKHLNKILGEFIDSHIKSYSTAMRWHALRSLDGKIHQAKGESDIVDILEMLSRNRTKRAAEIRKKIRGGMKCRNG